MLAVLKMSGLSLPGKDCYAYKGEMFMLDERVSAPHDGFYLLQLVTEKCFVPGTSGETTPTHDEVCPYKCASVAGKTVM